MRSSPEPDLVLPTAGACMRPWIWPGGLLGVRRCRVSELRIGDIAVWFDGREVRSHRVVALGNGGQFVTRGDLGANQDQPASDAELMGRAVSFQALGLRYRLDRGLPHLAGSFLARSPWVGAAFRLAYQRPRRLVGRLAERVYTAGPARKFRRRVHTPDWRLVIDRTVRGLRITALSRASVSGRIHVRGDGLVEELWVKRSQRGLGLGRMLVERAIAEAPGIGIPPLRCRHDSRTVKSKRLLALLDLGSAGRTRTPAATECS